MATADPVELLGLVAGLVSTLASAPQLWKIIATKRADDVSLTMFVMALVGTVLWSAYGFAKGAYSIVFWNAVGFVLFIAVITLKLRHQHAKRPA